MWRYANEKIACSYAAKYEKLTTCSRGNSNWPNGVQFENNIRAQKYKFGMNPSIFTCKQITHRISALFQK